MKEKNGFSLIELVVAITVIGVLAGIAVPLIRSSFDTWYYIEDRKEALYNARIALDTITRDLYQINGRSGLVIGTNQIQFVRVNGSTIQYRLNGTNLLRNGYVLAANIQPTTGLAFTYFDGTRGATLTPSSVKSIRITVIVTAANGNVQITSQITPRNF